MTTPPPAWATEPALLFEWAARLSIAHHIPGRIRLKLGLDGLDLTGLGEGLRRFTAALTACPGVIQLQVNLLARSCTLLYDTKVIAPSTWTAFIAGQQTEPVQWLIDAIAAAARAHTDAAQPTRGERNKASCIPS